MTEINQRNFCTLFKNCKKCKIQLFHVIPPVNRVIKFQLQCLLLEVFTNIPQLFLSFKFGKFDNLLLVPPAGSLAENDGKKYGVSEIQIILP